MIIVFLWLLLETVMVPAAKAESPAYHVVKPGEGLWSVAIRYGVTIQALVQANKLINPNWIYAGQVLVVPAGATTSGNSSYHTVSAGESIWTIATQYGVSAWSIVYKNRIANPDMIYVGQTLAIPGSAAGSISSKNTSPTTSAVQNVPKSNFVKPYAVASFGYDISSPQCRNAFPAAPHSFVVVGVNNGRTFRANPCFATEYDWAANTSGLTPSIYMNLSYPIGATAVNGYDGPAGRCAVAEEACKAYNYGYNAAKYSYDYAGRRNALVWWLDIELSNSWSYKTSMNDRVIQGAVDFFQNKGLTVGAYSSVTQWSKIAGAGFKPKLTSQPSFANWVFGADDRNEAATFCSSDRAFGGGTVWLAQYPSGRFDGNYVC